MTKKERYIILLGKNKIDFYSDLSRKILRLELPVEIFSDLEIVNEDLAFNHITSFINTNKIVPSDGILLIGDLVMFQKDIPLQPKMSQADQKRMTEEFVNKVPFEATSYKVVPLQRGVRVFAANKSVYDLLSRILERNRFNILAVAPLSDYSPQGANDITQTVIQKLLKKYDSLKGDQFQNTSDTQIATVPEDSVSDSETEEVPEENNTKKSMITKRALILLGVLGVLLIILVFLLLKTFIFSSNDTQSDTPYNQATLQPSAPASSPTPIPTSIDSKETVNILILVEDLSSSDADKLKNLFIDSGFMHVSVEEQAIEGGSNFMVFKPTVTESLQDEAVSVAENIIEDISTRISTDNASDITILLK